MLRRSEHVKIGGRGLMGVQRNSPPLAVVSGPKLSSPKLSSAAPKSTILFVCVCGVCVCVCVCVSVFLLFRNCVEFCRAKGVIVAVDETFVTRKKVNKGGFQGHVTAGHKTTVFGAAGTSPSTRWHPQRRTKGRKVSALALET